MAYRRTTRRLTLLIVLLLAVAATAVYLDQRDLTRASPQGPSGTRADQRDPGGSATRRAADISEVRGAVDQLDKTLDRRPMRDTDWEAARRQADEIRERWVSFKTPMRANAGHRMWSTSDVNQFEGALDQVQTQISVRNAARAKDRVDLMRGLIEKYDDTREGRLQTGEDD